MTYSLFYDWYPKASAVLYFRGVYDDGMKCWRESPTGAYTLAVEVMGVVVELIRVTNGSTWQYNHLETKGAVIGKFLIGMPEDAIEKDVDLDIAEAFAYYYKKLEDEGVEGL